MAGSGGCCRGKTNGNTMWGLAHKPIETFIRLAMGFWCMLLMQRAAGAGTDTMNRASVIESDDISKLIAFCKALRGELCVRQANSQFWLFQSLKRSAGSAPPATRMTWDADEDLFSCTSRSSWPILATLYLDISGL